MNLSDSRVPGKKRKYYGFIPLNLALL